MRYINFLDNDIQKAYCLRGSLDICECDLNTDLFKVISPGASAHEDLFCNVFENKDGQAFFAHTRAGQPSILELRRISGQPVALIENQEPGKLRSVATFKTSVVGVTEHNALIVFSEAGLCDWKPKVEGEGSIQQMMQEEIDEDETDVTAGQKGMKNKLKTKKY